VDFRDCIDDRRNDIPYPFGNGQLDRLPGHIAEEALVSQDEFPPDMGMDHPEKLGVLAGLLHLGVIHDHAHRILALLGVGPDGDAVQKSPVDGVDDLSPVDVGVPQEAVEDILPASEKLLEDTADVVPGILKGEEREEHHKLERLGAGHLAVGVLLDSHPPLIDTYPLHRVHDCRHRSAVVVFAQKAFEFRNNFGIFVHKLRTIFLYVNPNIVIFN